MNRGNFRRDPEHVTAGVDGLFVPSFSWACQRRWHRSANVRQASRSLSILVVIAGSWEGAQAEGAEVAASARRSPDV